jgi:uncharacterized protein (TIGR03083 family)
MAEREPDRPSHASDPHLAALRNSSAHLREIVTPLDDEQIAVPAYPTEWSIAQVVSHVGSGAVIMHRRLDDTLADRATPDEFAPAVWDVWNAKSPREQVDDGLAADRALVEHLDELTDDEWTRLRFDFGPFQLDASGFVGMRVNEHVMHTWDVEVALDPGATLTPEHAALLVDNLELIARFTATPTGSDRTIRVRTTDPDRSFTIALTADQVTLAPVEAPGTPSTPDLTMTAEAFARLVYGRLDAEHADGVDGDDDALDELRQVYPGP